MSDDKRCETLRCGVVAAAMQLLGNIERYEDGIAYACTLDAEALGDAITETVARATGEKVKGAVNITDPSVIPERFLVKTAVPDRRAILAALQAGKEVAGAELGRSG